MYTIENLGTKNFKPVDFFKSKTAKANNIDNLQEFLKQPNFQEMLLDGIHLANRMQKLRDVLNDIYQDKIGKEITIAINSAYRCPAVNKLVGGKVNSQHMKLQACDFYSPELKTISLRNIVKAVKEAKFEVDQMLVEETWIHFSTKMRDNRNMFGSYLFNTATKKREFKAV
jgi:zinc D-Ala-D-Ala carboxypeptidase